MQNYMLIMTGRSQDWKSFSPDETQAIMEKYFAFVDLLKKEHGFVAGSPLKEGGFGLAKVGDRLVVDGPFPETKEVLNGYMIFKAESLAHAVEIAKACPALTHGEAVQVFEMGMHS